MRAGAGGDERGSGDNGDFAAGAARPAQFLGDLANDGKLRFLGINDVVNELKRIGMRCGSLYRHNPDSLVSDNNLVAFFDVEKLNGTRTAFLPINGDCAIDNPWRHFDLRAAETNKRLLVGGYVELGPGN